MEFLTLLRFGFIVYIFEFMSEFLKTFIYPGKILLMLKQPPSPPSCFTFISCTFRHFEDASCSCGISQVITKRPCLDLHGFSCLSVGQESICHVRYPLRIFPADSQIWTGFQSQAHSSDPPGSETPSLSLPCIWSQDVN